MSKITEWLRSHPWIAWCVAVIAVAIAIYETFGFHWEISKPWVLGAIVLLVATYFVWTVQSRATAEDGSPMPLGDRRFLTAYLLLAGLVIVYMLVSLSSLDFPEPGIVPEPYRFKRPQSLVQRLTRIKALRLSSPRTNQTRTLRAAPVRGLLIPVLLQVQLLILAQAQLFNEFFRTVLWEIRLL